MHLRNATHRQEDYWALNEYNPGSVVLLSRQLVDWSDAANDWVMSNDQKALADWLKARIPYPSQPNNPANMEVFVRIYPSTHDRPIYGQPYQGQSNNGVVDEIFRVYDKVVAYNGLVISRYLPGNEPNLPQEWPDVDSTTDAGWDAIASYYTDVYGTVDTNKGTRNIELYTPAMGQEYYAEERNPLNPNQTFPLSPSGVLGGYNRPSVKDMIQLYSAFSWHNYFLRNNAWQNRVEEQFPQWLKDHLWVDLAPARITEAGWHPTQTTDRDTTVGTPVYWDDINYFMRTATQAGGVMVWLVSSPDCTLDSHKQHVSVKDASCWNDGTGNQIRRWVRELAIVAP